MTLALDSLRAACVALEEAAAAGPLDAPVRWCPGTDVAATLRHLGVVHRLVRRWVKDGHRPTAVPQPPAGAAPVAWFREGWQPLLDTLSSLDPGADVSTWCAYDTTARFWWRRMTHETTVHAFDVLDTVGWPWPVPVELAEDGVDEALRLWLGVALGRDVGGAGQVVRLAGAAVPGSGAGRFWTVGLNDHNVEVNHLPVTPRATVTAEAPVLYRWVWGRADDGAVAVTGDVAAVRALRKALVRAMQ